MRTLNVELGERSYAIHIGGGLLTQPALLLPHLPQDRAVVISNTTVAPLYLDPLTRTLKAHGVQVIPIILPDGESYKDWQTLNTVFDELLKQRCERRTPVVALGGGVIGDTAGFAAAVYQRGVPFIQIATTLLAQVDSAVGGKTAINHPLGKNMIGAFYQPRVVLADIDTLATLPERELAAGLAEVIKYGAIRDIAFFAWLEANMDRLVSREPDALGYAVEQCCRNKAEVVAQDERESGLRALLNFGHTFGHAIEAGLGFGSWLHGEAVAAGMALAAQLSERLGYIDRTTVERLTTLLARARLPTKAPDLGVERYLDLMGRDKKVEDGRLRFVLLRTLGAAFVTEAPAELLKEVLENPAVHA